MTRPSWDSYFMQMAHLVATRSTCPRRHVGAILVQGKRIISTGYNGSLPGQAHCNDIGCIATVVNGGCTRTIHAEINAICQAARHGIKTSDATIYVTTSPCLSCFKDIAAAGIIEVVYDEEYRECEFLSFAKLAGMTVRRHDTRRSTQEGRSPG